MELGFLVQGLFEISDSIGYDCVFQYRSVLKGLPGLTARIFAERFVPERYPDVPIENMDAFRTWANDNPDGIIVYHFCGAWPEIDTLLALRAATTVVRWHNNTPPWFYMDGNRNNLVHTLAGFESIVELTAFRNIVFWVNSKFTKDQFLALGGGADRCEIIYPASRYLGGNGRIKTPRTSRKFAEGGLNILFVGRVVAHKGHCGVVATASRLQKLTGTPVKVVFAGREGDEKKKIEELAASIGIRVGFYGEITDSELVGLYQMADVFLCLSEHEGFGLPVFEAMRCSVPVVAWAATALKELLEEHPLSFPYYDLNTFAAAVATLQDPGVRGVVLAAQERILTAYTEGVVGGQIEKAISAVKGDGGRETFLEIAPPALVNDSIVAEQVLGCLKRTRQLPTRKEGMPHDSSANLLSLYDIKVYRRFFDELKKGRFVAFQAIQERPTLEIPPAEFSRRFGRITDGILKVPYGNYPAHHMVFGPYWEFPSGSYEVTVDLNSEVMSARDVEFELDVNVPGHGILANTIFSANDLSSDAKRLRFLVPADLVVVEFRLRPTAPFFGSLEFRGAKVRNVANEAHEIDAVAAGLRRKGIRNGFAALYGRLRRARSPYISSQGVRSFQPKLPPE